MIPLKQATEISKVNIVCTIYNISVKPIDAAMQTGYNALRPPKEVLLK